MEYITGNARKKITNLGQSGRIRKTGPDLSAGAIRRGGANVISIATWGDGGLVSQAKDRSRDVPASEIAENVTDFEEIAAHLEMAMIDWAARKGSERSSSQSREDLAIALPGIIHEMNGSVELDREVTDPHLRQALKDRFGNASLRLLAGMTPQEILDLPGCGPASLKFTLAKLRPLRVLTFPELVSGSVKAASRLSGGNRTADAMAQDLLGMMGLSRRTPVKPTGPLRAQASKTIANCESHNAKNCEMCG